MAATLKVQFKNSSLQNSQTYEEDIENVASVIWDKPNYLIVNRRDKEPVYFSHDIIFGFVFIEDEDEKV